MRPPSDIPWPEIGPEWRTEVVGASVLGRDVLAFVRPVEGPRRRIVVVGGIHGNEPVSPPTVRGFLDAAIPPDLEIWLVPELNPDGVAAGTRANANDVDLNRNFSWTWHPSDGGPAPFSEPETIAVRDLITGIRPDLVVWVHQPLGYVSSIGATPSEFEQAWSAGSGVPVRPDVTQHGGGESWTAFEAGLPSMLIEIDSWEATPEIVAAHRAGFEALLGVL